VSGVGDAFIAQPNLFPRILFVNVSMRNDRSLRHSNEVSGWCLRLHLGPVISQTLSDGLLTLLETPSPMQSKSVGLMVASRAVP
jgi:hypothetical protein